MSRKLVDEIMVPAEHARAFHVKSGQTMRIIAVEGPQVGEVAIFNAHNYKEVYDPSRSWVWGCFYQTGNAERIQHLYSRPPRMNVMLEVTEDVIQRHWVWSGARCNRLSYEFRGAKGPVRNCFDNLAEAIAPFGMTAEDVPDVFNLWLNVAYTPDGACIKLPSLARKGDHIDFLGHMDCLIALSACPGNQQDITPINGGVNKPLKVEIYE